VDKKQKYNQLLREGKTEEATKVASEMRSDLDVEEVSDEGHDRFVELNGVGDELADEMVEAFGDVERFVEEADVESLSDISGIGESRAESLLEQV